MPNLEIRDLDAHNQIEMAILIYKNQYGQHFEGRGYFQHYLFITLFSLTGYTNWLTQVFYLGFPCELIDNRVKTNLPQRVPVPQNCSCSLILLVLISQK